MVRMVRRSGTILVLLLGILYHVVVGESQVRGTPRNLNRCQQCIRRCMRPPRNTGGSLMNPPLPWTGLFDSGKFACIRMCSCELPAPPTPAPPTTQERCNLCMQCSVRRERWFHFWRQWLYFSGCQNACEDCAQTVRWRRKSGFTTWERSQYKYFYGSRSVGVVVVVVVTGVEIPPRETTRV